MKPYVYKLKHKPSGRIYIGSQYGKTCDPKNLWNTYFTSSKYIKELIEIDGYDSFEIVKIKETKTVEQTRKLEAKYLQMMYYTLGREKFIEIYINRNISPGILLTDEIIEKANIKRRISNSISAQKLVQEGRHNFQLNPHKPSCDEIEKTRQRMIGNKFYENRIITDEFRKNQTKDVRGNTNVRGRFWWNNGIERKRSFECPGEGWILGFTRNEQDRENISKSCKGTHSKIKSEKHKESLRYAALKRVKNGTHNFLKKEA